MIHMSIGPEMVHYSLKPWTLGSLVQSQAKLVSGLFSVWVHSRVLIVNIYISAKSVNYFDHNMFFTERLTFY